MLERLFQLKQNGSNVKTEIVAGITTFFTMVYIVFVNPSILGVAGMDTQVVFVTTCLIAAFGTIAMGLFSNLPIALAPAMGLNAFFAFVVVQKLGYSWQIGMGRNFLRLGRAVSFNLTANSLLVYVVHTQRLTHRYRRGNRLIYRVNRF